MTNPVALLQQHDYTTKEGVRKHWRSIIVHCPGCDQMHEFDLRDADGTADKDRPIFWEWDGNLESPTFSPSLLCFHTVHRCPPDYEHRKVCEDPQNCGQPGHLIMNAERYEEIPPEGERVLGHPTPHIVDPPFGPCHSFLRNGVWEFLPDSAHALAGQNVPLEPLSDGEYRWAQMLGYKSP